MYGMAGPYVNLFTKMWSPTWSVGIIEPLGILKASTTNARSAIATAIATRIDSAYSRTSLLRQRPRRTSTSPSAFTSASTKRLLVEGLALHRVLESIEVDAELLALLRREVSLDRLLVLVEDRLGLFEERASALERTAQALRQIGAERRMRVIRERQMVPHGPHRHLEQRERHDADRNGLLAHPALDPAEHAAVVDAARRRQRPDEDARERERRDARTTRAQ